MTFIEIIHKEDITGNRINLYRDGLFWRAYEQSAYRFVFGILSCKPSKRTIKAIATEVISIRIPAITLEKFAALFDILSQNDKQMVIEPKNLVTALTFKQWKDKILLSKLKHNVSKEQSIEILYRNLCELMEAEMVFTSQIGRKELADMLQTNTTYIVEVIKRFSEGMTVTAFINRYRLRYAGKLLSERTDLSVDAIGEEAGFTSRSTYYRQFRDYYGMSPNEYRSISRNSN